MLGLVKQIGVGICGDAKAAAKAPMDRLANRELACRHNAKERRAEIARAMGAEGVTVRNLGDASARPWRRPATPRSRARPPSSRSCVPWSSAIPSAATR